MIENLGNSMNGWPSRRSNFAELSGGTVADGVGGIMLMVPLSCTPPWVRRCHSLVRCTHAGAQNSLRSREGTGMGERQAWGRFCGDP